MLASRTSRLSSSLRPPHVASYAALAAGSRPAASAAAVALRRSLQRAAGVSRPPAYSLASSGSSSRCWSSQPEAVVAVTEAAQEEAAPVLEVDYDEMYANYISLTGTLASPRHNGSSYSFMLQVERRDSSPPVLDWWPVEASGHIAELAAQRCREGMLVAVQGSVAVTSGSGGPVQGQQLVVRPIEIGLVRMASPESLVGAADPGVRPQAADPAQYQYRPQQQAPGGAAVVVPGMPAASADPTEAKWLRLFANPNSWFDNRTTKRGKQPDFKEKVTGDALWLESRSTPLWVFEGLGQLPGNLPYSGTYYAWRLSQDGASSPAVAAAAAAASLPFLPAEPSSELEAKWVDVFSRYSNWWDNRLTKRNPKAPDFKHKSSDMALWLTDTNVPAWVAEHINTALPPAPRPRE